LISLRKQQLAKLDELVKARFVEMFGDCKTNPKNWKTKALEKIANVGSSKRVFVEELQDSGIPFYRGTEIGALAEKKAVIPALFITEEHYKQLCETTGKPQKGDLLMPSICPDGRIWIVDTDEPFYFKDGRVLWVHLTSANYNSVFLLYTLKDRIMTDYASIASGTTFAELKIFALKKCKIFDAPLELQNQFANFVERVDQQKQTVQQSLDKLELMKKALMQEYFG
ncbi:MAG: restriction endonuclease subunit S, partial [Anaerobutyricum sp.]